MRVDWSEPAATTVTRIRASSPNWGVRASLAGEPVKIFAASVSPIASSSTSSPQVGTAPGTVAALNRSEIIIRAGDGQGVAITEIQFAGKRRLLVKDYLAGNPIPVGTKFDDGQ